MAYFAGLDVSVKETSICIVDDAGRIVREAIATSLLRCFRVRARGSASMSAHHSSVAGSCGCDYERLSTSSSSVKNSEAIDRSR